MERTKKHSRKREAILACIRETKRHPSAEWIYDRLKPEIPDLSRGTVYRNLRLFLAEGEVSSVGVVDGLERFDGDVTPHAHFICRACGAVTDLTDMAVPEALLARAEALSGGRVEGSRLSFSGLCHACAQTE